MKTHTLSSLLFFHPADIVSLGTQPFKVKGKSLSVWLFVRHVSPCQTIHGLYSPWNSPGQDTAVGSLSLLQGIFPTQGSNASLPCCRQILDSWATRKAQSGVGSLSQETNQGLLALQADSLPTELSEKTTFQNLKLSTFSLEIPSPFQCFSDGYHCFSIKSKLKITRHSIIQ